MFALITTSNVMSKVPYTSMRVPVQVSPFESKTRVNPAGIISTDFPDAVPPSLHEGTEALFQFKGLVPVMVQFWGVAKIEAPTPTRTKINDLIFIYLKPNLCKIREVTYLYLFRTISKLTYVVTISH